MYFFIMFAICLAIKTGTAFPICIYVFKYAPRRGSHLEMIVLLLPHVELCSLFDKDVYEIDSPFLSGLLWFYKVYQHTT